MCSTRPCPFSFTLWLTDLGRDWIVCSHNLFDVQLSTWDRYYETHVVTQIHNNELIGWVGGHMGTHRHAVVSDWPPDRILPNLVVRDMTGQDRQVNVPFGNVFHVEGPFFGVIPFTGESATEVWDIRHPEKGCICLTGSDRREQIVGLFTEAQRFALERTHRMAATNASRIKSPRDSWCTKLLPYGSDPAFRSQNTSAYGTLRVGKLLEHLDAFASAIAYKHCDLTSAIVELETEGGGGAASTASSSAPSMLTIVTAAVDRIIADRSFYDVRSDVRLCGCVTWVGRSSMDIRIEARVVSSSSSTPASPSPSSSSSSSSSSSPSSATSSSATSAETEGDATVAFFLMAARDPVTHAAAVVPPLAPGTPEERGWNEDAIKRQQQRRQRVEHSLRREPPSVEEWNAIHSFFMQKSLQKETYLPMSKTEFKNTLFMQPQERNIHRKIFGGFLMRIAYELAWVTVHMVYKVAPLFLSIDDLNFLKPVEIGSLVTLTSRIVYTTGNTVQVAVETIVHHPTTTACELTFNAHFTLAVPQSSVICIQPESYEEAMLFLEGRRRYQTFAPVEFPVNTSVSSTVDYGTLTGIPSLSNYLV
ncbi:acyl-CoA Thioesterase [Pelomyxa schiedti]|nr:acyl-CoA Thioesterase [Pelomyxa schiedti]